MKTLSQTWFAEGFIDFELKKYTLLAYLQEVNSYFTENKLYPQLADVIFHYNNMVRFRENKKFLQEHFPKKLTGIEVEKLQLLYEQMIEDDELMELMGRANFQNVFIGIETPNEESLKETKKLQNVRPNAGTLLERLPLRPAMH